MKKTLIVLTLAAMVAAQSTAYAATSDYGPGVTAEAKETFRYQHDPQENASAMKDIVVNPDAVYGFSPDPNSKRLGSFAEFDWTDTNVVEGAKQERIAYHNQNEAMYHLLDELEAEGRPIEEIARRISAERNQIRLRSYDGNPEGLAAVKKSNLETYGNEEGPTADSLFEKYGSWETVLEKAFSVNSGMDACLGLYDRYYSLYVTTGQIPGAKPAPTVNTYIVKTGDNLSKIAEITLGTRNAWTRIYEANRAQIKNPDVIYAGQVFVIPSGK